MADDEKTMIVQLKDLNCNLVCPLCAGYLIDATTITECAHTFCKSCIVKHLQMSYLCPQCETKVHETQPLLRLKSDRVMQEIVYKLVPNLVHDEKVREEKFSNARGIEFRRSGSHLLNIDSYRVNQDKREQEQPVTRYNKYRHIDVMHKPKFDEKINFKLTPRNIVDGKSTWVLCPVRATVFHLKRSVAKDLDIVPKALTFFCYGTNLKDTMNLKQVAMTYHGANANAAKNDAIPITYTVV